jgi:hypothetical protein
MVSNALMKGKTMVGRFTAGNRQVGLIKGRFYHGKWSA